MMVDQQIGRILDHLDTLGSTNNIIAVFASDHGDMSGSHGGLFDKGYLYEEAHRVPLIISLPDEVPGQQRRKQLVDNMDVSPTVLDLLGERDASLDGQFMRPYMTGSAPEGRLGIYLEFHGLRFLFS